MEPRGDYEWDGLGHPAADRALLPPPWKRWKIDYDQALTAIAETVTGLL